MLTAQKTSLIAELFTTDFELSWFTLTVPNK